MAYVLLRRRRTLGTRSFNKLRDNILVDRRKLGDPRRIWRGQPRHIVYLLRIQDTMRAQDICYRAPITNIRTIFVMKVPLQKGKGFRYCRSSVFMADDLLATLNFSFLICVYYTVGEKRKIEAFLLRRIIDYSLQAFNFLSKVFSMLHLATTQTKTSLPQNIHYSIHPYFTI